MSESPNTLLSNSVITWLDLLGEGPISGFIRQTGAYGSDPLCATRYDDVPVRNPDGSYNFNVSGQGYTFNYTLGTTAQSGIPGFQKVENIIPLSSNTRVANPPPGAGPWKPVICSFTTATYPDADSVKVTIRVPALYSQDTNGNINPYSMSYAVDISLNNGPWVQQSAVPGTPAANLQIVGKCTTPYLETTLFSLPKPTVPTASSEWKIRVRRTDQNVLSTNTQNELFVDTIAVVSTNLYAYPNSVLVGTKISADQFASIPSRSYEIAGLLVNVPSGYQPTQYPPYDYNFTRQCDIDLGVKHIGFTVQDPGQLANVYTGTRVAGPGIPTGSVIVATNPNGPYFFTIDQDPTATSTNTAVTFINSNDTGILPAQYPTVWYGNYVSGVWTDNPAWIFNDLLTNPTRGLGDYIQSGAVDKWTLYGIAQYCDQMVDDGAGGLEPNFTCNVVIQQPDDAYSVLLNLASTFRGMLYYGNGAIHPVQTSNKTPSFAFTNANVVDGKFSYSDTAQNTRSTVAMVKWVDPKNGYRENVEYIEDLAGIARYGYQEKQVTAFACTSKGQAYRLGSWTLQSEQLLTETITFQTDLEGFSVQPGEAFAVYDNFRNNRSQGGRVVGFDPTRSLLTLDRNVTLTAGLTYSLTTIIPKFTLDGTGDLTGSNQIPFIDQSQIETYVVTTPPTLTTNQLLISGTFSTGLFIGTPWVLAASGSSSVFQNASFYTCLATAEVEPGKIEVLGLQANTGINFVISTGYTTAGYPVNSGDHSPIDPPTSLTAIEVTGMTVPDNVFYDVIRLTWVAPPSLQLAYFVVSGKEFNQSYTGDTVFGTGYDFPRNSTGQYSFKLAAASYGGVQSSFVSTTLTLTNVNPLGRLKGLSGIQIIEDFDPLYRLSSGYTGFIGTTPTFSWDVLRDANSNPTVDFQFISGYRLSLKSFDDTTDYVTPFTISGNENTSYELPSGMLYNAVGGQQRGFLFKVDTVDIYGNIATGASLKVNNPSLRVPFSSGFVGYNGGILYNVTPAADNDVSGVYVWYNTSSSLVPTPSNVSYVSDNLAGSINNSIYQLTPYYLWYAPVDTFGFTGSRIYGPIPVDPNGSVSGAYFNLSQSIASVSASIAGVAAQVVTVQTALASTGSSLAQWLTYLSVVTSGVTSSASTLINAGITGGSNGTGGAAFATWGFELNANGKAVGVRASATSFTGIGNYSKMTFSGVTLESDSYVPGVRGWQLDPSGNFEGNKGTFRGTLIINSGSTSQILVNGAGILAGKIGGGQSTAFLVSPDEGSLVYSNLTFANGAGLNVAALGVAANASHAGILRLFNGTDQTNWTVSIDGNRGDAFISGGFTGVNFSVRTGVITSNPTATSWKGDPGLNTAGLYVQNDQAGGGLNAVTYGNTSFITLAAAAGSFSSISNLTAGTVGQLISQHYSSGGWYEGTRIKFGILKDGDYPYIQLRTTDNSNNLQSIVLNYDGKLYFQPPNDVFSPNASVYPTPPYVAEPLTNLYRSSANNITTDATLNVANLVSAAAVLAGGNFTALGNIRFGTFTATPATSAGYITITDAGGTTRKLMVGT